MNKKLINGVLLATLLAGSAGSFTSCTDYDDDIKNLQGQIDAINVDLGKLQEIIKSGETVKSVAQNGDGVTITMGDGKTYTIKNGTNGKDGVNGKDADVWTIGADGYWYKNSVKTEYKAVGTNGTNGTDGKYYVPNTTTGCFDIYQDGKLVETTTIRWREESVAPATPAMSAVFTGNQLTFANVDAGKKNDKGEVIYESVQIPVGEAIGSIEFVPSVMSSVVPYPTTDKEFYHLLAYYSEAKYNQATKDFIVQTDWDKSNVVDLVYRLNPSKAYLYEGAYVEFINRAVTSRAEGDNKTLLNVKTYTEKVNDEDVVRSFKLLDNNEINVQATINARNLASGGKNNIAALSAWNGQNRTVADYVAVASKAIDAVLVDSAYMKANPSAGVKGFYNRTKAIVDKDAETSDFIKNFVTLSDPVNAELVYNSTLDLSKLPGLYSKVMSKYLSELDFYGMTYKFTLPEKYLADDAPQYTNQQWFVQLDGNILKVNTNNLTDGLTPAIGRTPVVRVDAFLSDNSGVEHLVASAYIKVEIVREPTVAPQPQPDYKYELGIKEYEYHNLNATAERINWMDWTAVNNKIYGVTGLTSGSFWQNYGGANKEYNVTVTTIDQNGNTVTLGNGKALADQPFELVTNGISCKTTLGSASTQTSNIEFFVDNKVKTENTYKDVNSKGAEYTVTITIPSNNVAARGNVVVIQKFYVKEDCKPYEFNPNFYAGTVDGKADVVITKGKLVSGAWKLEMNISEVFEIINGKNIFEYYNTVNNASAISFSLNPDPQVGVNYTESGVNGTIELTAPLSESQKFAPMKYVVTLVNGETCTFYYNILFKNPFVGTTGNEVTLNGNATGKTQKATANEVRVNDVNGQAIYSWNTVSNSLKLSDLATGTYKVAAPTCKYEFIKDANYNKFYGNLDINNGAKFEIDETTGVVTYDNLGATLIPSYDLRIKVTVTFANLSVVECYIPFKVKGQN